ncbi:MAG TPA: hypothetical protein VJ729_02060 [Nitrososphaeraceae archaeon]|nr:hypothetical protein [Nitrososphaeraceae archaeon]
MSCNTKGLSRKRKIIILSSLGSGMIAVSYLTFTTTSNPAVAATLPALLYLAACPAMCVGMGGMMWFMSRFSKKKNKDNQKSIINHDRVEVEEKVFEHSCCGHLPENNEAQNTDYQSMNTSEDNLVQPPSLWPTKYRNKLQSKADSL